MTGKHGTFPHLNCHQLVRKQRHRNLCQRENHSNISLARVLQPLLLDMRYSVLFQTNIPYTIGTVYSHSCDFFRLILNQQLHNYPMLIQLLHHLLFKMFQSNQLLIYLVIWVVTHLLSLQVLYNVLRVLNVRF